MPQQGLSRSPYDHSQPAPSEELLGIVYGIQQGEACPQAGVEALKHWMLRHLSDEELDRLSQRDPLWGFEEMAGTDKYGGLSLLVEWGMRIKNGAKLPPLPGMRYQVKLTVID